MSKISHNSRFWTKIQETSEHHWRWKMQQIGQSEYPESFFFDVTRSLEKWNTYGYLNIWLKNWNLYAMVLCFYLENSIFSTQFLNFGNNYLKFLRNTWTKSRQTEGFLLQNTIWVKSLQETNNSFLARFDTIQFESSVSKVRLWSNDNTNF